MKYSDQLFIWKIIFLYKFVSWQWSLPLSNKWSFFTPLRCIWIHCPLLQVNSSSVQKEKEILAEYSSFTEHSWKTKNSSSFHMYSFIYPWINYYVPCIYSKHKKRILWFGVSRKPWMLLISCYPRRTFFSITN